MACFLRRLCPVLSPATPSQQDPCMAMPVPPLALQAPPLPWTVWMVTLPLSLPSSLLPPLCPPGRFLGPVFPVVVPRCLAPSADPDHAVLQRVCSILQHTVQGGSGCATLNVTSEAPQTPCRALVQLQDDGRVPRLLVPRAPGHLNYSTHEPQPSRRVTFVTRIE
jgi:hypothetical protein